MPYLLLNAPHASEESHRIFYKKFGHDSAPHKMIFTMGLGGTADQWEPQITYFASRPAEFQFVVFDNRGMGFSDPVAGRWTTTKMARDALGLLDHLGWRDKVHVIGLSMGGMISQELVRLQPCRFASLSLLSTIAGGPFSLYLFVLAIPTGMRLVAQTFLTADPRAQLKNGMKLLYPASFLEGSSAHPLTGELTSNFKLFRGALIRRGMQAKQDNMPPQSFLSIIKQGFAVMTHNVSHQELAHISRVLKGNVLVVTGDEDVLVHPRNAERLRDGLGAELVVMKHAGHGANEQYAQEVNKAIETKVLLASKL
jgi:pimeloyl-ACP methyl ester carboxylesterase